MSLFQTMAAAQMTGVLSSSADGTLSDYMEPL